jgi:hypothetical protein
MTKTETKRLTDIDVLNRSSDSEWAAPTFIQAKKTGDVCILTDFRRLNEQIKRKPFPLPKISDLLRKLSGLKYATAIDLIMGYYHIPLDLEAQKLCKTILPWDKYQYKRLPMGVKTSPDIFQRITFNVIYFNCAFTKIIVPKAGNRTLATMPARESWVGARLSNSCSPSGGLIAFTVC